MKNLVIGCLLLVLGVSLVLSGCGSDTSTVAGTYSADMQGEAAQTIGATTWTLEFREDGTFEEVIVTRDGEKRTITGTYEITNNSIDMYDAGGGLMEDDFTIQDGRLVDQLGGVWIKQ